MEMQVYYLFWCSVEKKWSMHSLGLKTSLFLKIQRLWYVIFIHSKALGSKEKHAGIPICILPQNAVCVKFHHFSIINSMPALLICNSYNKRSGNLDGKKWLSAQQMLQNERKSVPLALWIFLSWLNSRHTERNEGGKKAWSSSVLFIFM